MLTSIFVSLIASALGTFLGNLALLWLISWQAKQAERRQLEAVAAMQRAAIERIREDVKRKQEYIEMES